MLGLNSTFARAVKKSAFGAVPDTFVMDEVQIRHGIMGSLDPK